MRARARARVRIKSRQWKNAANVRRHCRRRRRCSDACSGLRTLSHGGDGDGGGGGDGDGDGAIASSRTAAAAALKSEQVSFGARARAVQSLARFFFAR